MTNERQDTAFEEAALWHARIEGDGADWEGFALWLDADPMHQKAYEQLALIDDEATRWARRQDEPPARTVEPQARNAMTGRRWIGGSAIAASLAALISVPLVWNRAPTPPVYYSANNGQKLVTLGDGSSARLDHGTRLAVADGGKGPVSLESGAAYFAVRHDPERAFTVQSGDFVIRDIGTRFEVTRRGDQMSVAVEEGVVDVSWRGLAATRLTAGQTLDASGNGAHATVRAVDPASVASWRNGRLIYDNQPLSLVAADISRYTSHPISVDPAVANLKLSGILLIEDGSHLVDQIKALLPVDGRRDGDHIRLVRAPSRR